MGAAAVLSLSGAGWTLWPDRRGDGDAEDEAPCSPGTDSAAQIAIPAHLPAGGAPDAERWVFERTVEVPGEWSGARLWLEVERIDGVASFYWNERRIGRAGPTHAPQTLEVTSAARPGEADRLCIVVRRVEDLQGEDGCTSRDRAFVPRLGAGGWTAPRLLPAGICGEVCLRATGPAAFRSVALYSNLSLDRKEASLAVVSEFDAPDRFAATVRAEVSFGGLPVGGAEDPLTLFPGDTSLVQSFRLPGVQLWWPNGAGAAPLYRARVTLLDGQGEPLDARQFDFGVRSLELLPAVGSPPDTPPQSLVVNGRPLAVKGWQWLPADVLQGAETAGRREHLLTLARDAGVNLLRVWGGGGVESEAFYACCDRLGILVWQDFPLCGSAGDSVPPTDAEYLKRLAADAGRLVIARRNHPSLAIWCGGSDLYDADGHSLGSDHAALDQLKQVVITEDPQRPWIPTAPAMSAPVLDPHDEVPPGIRFGRLPVPPAPAGGPARPQAGRLAPGEGAPVGSLAAGRVQLAVEAVRRDRGGASGILIWALNEPWPGGGPGAAVAWDGRPRPAYWAVRRALRPVQIGADFGPRPAADPAAGRFDVFLINEGEEQALLNVVATVTTLDGRTLHQENLATEAPAWGAEAVGDVAWRFPPGFAEPFVVQLEVVDEGGARIAANAYLRPSPGGTVGLEALSAPPTQVELHAAEKLIVRNVGSAPALFVTVEAPHDPRANFSDGDFLLLPGAAHGVDGPAGEGVRVAAWNAPAAELPGR